MVLPWFETIFHCQRKKEVPLSLWKSSSRHRFLSKSEKICFFQIAHESFLNFLSMKWHRNISSDVNLSYECHWNDKSNYTLDEIREIKSIIYETHVRWVLNQLGEKNETLVNVSLGGFSFSLHFHDFLFLLTAPLLNFHCFLVKLEHERNESN